MIRRPPRSTLSSSSAASDVYKRQVIDPVGRDLARLTDEVVGVGRLRLAPGCVLRAAVGVRPDVLLFLGIHRDHRLAGVQKTPLAVPPSGRWTVDKIRPQLPELSASADPSIGSQP